MPTLFPPEIIKGSSENYFSEDSARSRIIYLSVLLFIIGTIGLLPWIRVQVTTQSEGIVRSGQEDNPIIPVVTGEVISCKMRDNLQVKAHDTLMVIAADQINQEIKFLNYNLTEMSQICFDLQQLLDGENCHFKTAWGNQEYLSYSGRVAEENIKLVQAETDYKLAERLFQKGITPRYEFEKTASQYQYEIKRVNSIKDQQLTIWQEKLKESKLQLNEHNSKIAQLQKAKKQYAILAPVSGIITDFSGVKEGNFVLPNQPIAKISPNDDLLAECYVSSADIGLIEVGTPATFQFHAYNYNLWGMASGKVMEISGNVINLNNKLVFKVRCQLEQNFLKLKNGTKGELIKGMTLTGRFRVTDRTMFQLLYDKADNWLNPKMKNG